MRCSLLIVVVFVSLVGLVNVSQAATQAQCTTYCNTYAANCATFYPTYYPTVMNIPTCNAQCLAFPDNASLSAGGDSYQCRNYYATNANISQASYPYYCTAALPPGGGPAPIGQVCGTTYQNYCDKIMAGCTGANAQFSSYAQCMAEATFYPQVLAFNATTGDSFQCRTNVATAPLAISIVASTYCPAAGPFGNDGATANGASSCGTACQNYCDHYMITCTIANAGNVYQYASYSDCTTQCATWTKLALNYLVPTTGGNSFNCRSYHVLVAGTGVGFVGNLTYPEYHCPHAGPSGGGVCVGSPPVSSTVASSTVASSSSGHSGSAVALLPSSFLVVSLILLSQMKQRV